MKHQKISVIIPSYNELKNLNRGVLEQVYKYLVKQNYPFELLLSDDGSTDDTLNQLKKFAKSKNNVKVLQNKHRGKGPTILSAFLAAEGDLLLFTDFDQSTPINQLDKLLIKIKDCDIVIGSREGTGAKRIKEPIHRHLMGRFFNLVVQSITGLRFNDTQCGFKLLKKDVSKKLINKFNIYDANKETKRPFTGAFDVELLYLANKMGYKICEVPIKWQHFETDRVNPFTDSFQMFIDVIKIKIADLKGKYN